MGHISVMLPFGKRNEKKTQNNIQSAYFCLLKKGNETNKHILTSLYMINAIDNVFFMKIRLLIDYILVGLASILQ